MKIESDGYRKFIATEIRKKIIELWDQGVKTSKGEPMSLAAIGRTLDPPVTRQTVHLVVMGRAESARVKEAVEREIGQPYWIRRNAI